MKIFSVVRMCFDPQSSLLAWSLTYSIALYLYYRNENYDRWNALFIISFSTIQLLEAGIWKSLKSGNQWANDLLTRLILVVLLTQPLVQSYMGYRYTQQMVLAFTSGIFLGLLIWGLIRVWKSTPGQFHSSVGPNGHLIWSDSLAGSGFLGSFWAGALYVAGLFIPLFFMKDRKGWPLLFIGALTVAYSLFVSSKGEFASYWCYIAIVYAMAAVFV